jgi:hypothetical protein
MGNWDIWSNPWSSIFQPDATLVGGVPEKQGEEKEIALAFPSFIPTQISSLQNLKSAKQDVCIRNATTKHRRTLPPFFSALYITGTPDVWGIGGY